MCDLDAGPANSNRVMSQVNIFRNRMTTLYLTKQSIKHSSKSEKKDNENEDFFLFMISVINESNFEQDSLFKLDSRTSSSVLLLKSKHNSLF